MKLSQKIIITGPQELSTVLGALPCEMSHYEKLIGPCELAFHPYELEVWSKPEIFPDNKITSQIKLIWDIFISDDDEHKELLTHVSQHRSVLLLAEVILGIHELVKIINISLVSLIPKPHKNIVRLIFTPELVSCKLLVGQLLVLRSAFDSLLFARGLSFETHKLKFEPDFDVQNLETNLAALFNTSL
jgi:hypothetical protein